MLSDFELRTNIIKVIFSMVAILILGRIIGLQTNKANRDFQEYWEYVSSGYEKEITPARGLIYDRYGTPLATNLTVYEVNVNLEKSNFVGNAETIASVLSRILDIPYDDVFQKTNVSVKETGITRKIITSFVDQERIDQLALTYDEYENLNGTKKNPAPTLYGVEWTPFLIRQYPEEELASNIIGSVSKYGDARRGVEQQYDELLSGVPSKSLQTGLPNVIHDDDWPKGSSLVLTIDREIQRTVEDILDFHVDETGSLSGVVIVSDPETGDVLAMAATSRYDRLPENDPRIEFVNPAIESLYEPGSVSKVLTMAAALDAGLVTPDTPFLDTGIVEVGGVTVYNWDREGHGQVTMTGCMELSLNVCLASVARDMGVTTFYKYLDAFGIGHRSGIDLEGERIYPLAIPGEGNLAAHSFGQAMSLAPIQMVTAISPVANDGVMMAPRIVRSIISNGRQYDLPPKVISRPITAETAHTLTEMLTVSLQGESSNIKVDGYRLAGKTGTAQIAPYKGHPEYDILPYRTDATNASFVGWGPADDPKFLVYVWLEEPQTSPWGSVVAAPVFSDVVNELVVLMDIPPDAIRLQLTNQ